jgi:hypothetical protein
MTSTTCGAGTAYPSGAPRYNHGFSKVRVVRSLVFCVVFCGPLLVCLPFFSYDHCVVCSSSIYGFFLPLPTLLTVLPIIQGYQSKSFSRLTHLLTKSLACSVNKYYYNLLCSSSLGQFLLK